MSHMLLWQLPRDEKGNFTEVILDMNVFVPLYPTLDGRKLWGRVAT